MRTKAKTALVLASAGAVCFVSRGVRAQIDVNPPLPNVLLLVDNSGSMENMIDGRTPEASGNSCTPGTASAPNRWNTLLNVMTGTIQNFSCQAIDRTQASFGSGEYAFQNVAP